MLTFTISIKKVNPMGCQTVEKDVTWHVRDKPPREEYEEANLTVLSVYADGNELEHIKEEFTNLPYRKLGFRGANSSNIWRGEMARFIWDNL